LSFEITEVRDANAALKKLDADRPPPWFFSTLPEKIRFERSRQNG